MDTGDDYANIGENEDEKIMPNLFQSLHYRPGLIYDAWRDDWRMIPARPHVTTSSPSEYQYTYDVIYIYIYISNVVCSSHLCYL